MADLAGRHSINLPRPINALNPLDPLRRKQLRPRRIVVNHLHIIQHTRLDNTHAVDTAEGVAETEYSGAAVAAEKGSDGFPGVGGFGDLFGRAGSYFEVADGDYDL